MSAFIPPTPDDGEFVPDEEIAATVKDAVHEADERSARIAAFGDQIRDYPGQVGALLREIDHAWHEFCAAERMAGTTAGEEIRLGWILTEAMELWGRLNEVEGL